MTAIVVDPSDDEELSVRLEFQGNAKAAVSSFQMRTHEIRCLMTRSADRSKTHGSTVAGVRYLRAFIMRTVTPVLGSSPCRGINETVEH